MTDPVPGVSEPQLMLTQGPGVMGAPQPGYAAPAPGYAAPAPGYQNGPYGQPAAAPMPGYQGYSM